MRLSPLQGKRDGYEPKMAQIPFIYNQLAEDDAMTSIPLGVFGRVIYDKKIGNGIDIKGGALVHFVNTHFVNTMRLLSIFEGLEAVSTIERLQQKLMR